MSAYRYSRVRVNSCVNHSDGGRGWHTRVLADHLQKRGHAGGDGPGGGRAGAGPAGGRDGDALR